MQFNTAEMIRAEFFFDKPIVWPVTQLVPTMDQMLAGPGTK